MSAIKLSDCVSRIKESPTLAITAKAARYKSEGKDIIGLAAGEPDFDTPSWIVDGATHAMAEKKTRYTAVEGTKELRIAIQQKFKKERCLRGILQNSFELFMSLHALTI